MSFPIKTSKKNTLIPTHYFDMGLLTQIGPKHVVYLSKRKYKLSDELNSDEVNGISIKRSWDYVIGDISITNYRKTKPVKIDNITLNDSKITSFEEPTAEKGIYERFHLKGVLSEIWMILFINMMIVLHFHYVLLFSTIIRAA